MGRKKLQHRQPIGLFFIGVCRSSIHVSVSTGTCMDVHTCKHTINIQTQISTCRHNTIIDSDGHQYSQTNGLARLLLVWIWSVLTPSNQLQYTDNKHYQQYTTLQCSCQIRLQPASHAVKAGIESRYRDRWMERL